MVVPSMHTGARACEPTAAQQIDAPDRATPVQHRGSPQALQAAGV
jgi:hypothetical protein